MQFQCSICHKTYKRKTNYDKHVILCQILSNSKNDREREEEENNDIPSYKDLYFIVKDLASKYQDLKKDYDLLLSWVNQKKKKLNIIDWLNEHYKIEIYFDDWLNSIQITKIHLDYIFKFDYIDGIMYILHELCPLNDHDNFNLPIKAFNQKENVFFIFQKDDKWEVMSISLFNKFINTISKKLLDLFKAWQDENFHKMDDEKFQKIYIENVKKIIGGDTSIDCQNNKIKNKLFKYLKSNLKNVIEYEFTS